ncbi:ribonuclease P protein component [Actinomycetes bacterium KLBMP 9797]
MLATAHRLKRSSDFAATIRGGRRAGRGAVVVHLSLTDPATLTDPAGPADLETLPARTGESPARAGFVVSKAVGNAVIRNTVKRRLRHLVRERLASLPAGATLVVRALPGAAALPSTRLGADLDAALAAAVSPRRRRQP